MYIEEANKQYKIQNVFKKAFVLAGRKRLLFSPVASCQMLLANCNSGSFVYWLIKYTSKCCCVLSYAQQSVDQFEFWSEKWGPFDLVLELMLELNEG